MHPVLSVVCDDGEGIHVALLPVPLVLQNVPEGQALGVALVQHHVGAREHRLLRPLPLRTGREHYVG